MFQGDQVKDAEGVAAVFAELGTSASLMLASKLLDAVAMLPVCSGEQSDAIQAYTQALLYHGQKQPVETWIRLSKEQWPSTWHGKFRDPVVPLRLALHGHPLSGAFWARHCHAALLAVGFAPILGWECCFVHNTLQLVLSVYVDDFKMAGKSGNLSRGWDLIRSKILGTTHEVARLSWMRTRSLLPAERGRQKRSGTDCSP